MSQNRFNTTYVLFPLTRNEIEAAKLPELPEGRTIGGILLPPSEVERGYHRCLSDKDAPHLYDDPRLASAVKAQQNQMKTYKEDLVAAKKTAEQANTETNKWKKKWSDIQDEKQGLTQQITEAKAHQKAAEDERAVSDNLVDAREKERDDALGLAELRQKTIDRYTEKYQAVDRPFSAIQRFGAWLFGI